MFVGAASLDLNDCWIGAGLIRNAVWDHLHGYPIALHVNSDVDVVYCNWSDVRIETDVAIEARLYAHFPDIPWSVHNQARMHEANGDDAYRDTEDAIRHWPETATAIAARILGDRIEVIAPHGVDDLVNLVVRPTPQFTAKLAVYRHRVASKGWANRWPKLTFINV